MEAFFIRNHVFHGEIIYLHDCCFVARSKLSNSGDHVA